MSIIGEIIKVAADWDAGVEAAPEPDYLVFGSWAEAKAYLWKEYHMRRADVVSRGRLNVNAGLDREWRIVVALYVGLMMFDEHFPRRPLH